MKNLILAMCSVFGFCAWDAFGTLTWTNVSSIVCIGNSASVGVVVSDIYSTTDVTISTDTGFSATWTGVTNGQICSTTFGTGDVGTSGYINVTASDEDGSITTDIAVIRITAVTTGSGAVCPNTTFAFTAATSPIANYGDCIDWSPPEPILVDHGYWIEVFYDTPGYKTVTATCGTQTMDGYRTVVQVYLTLQTGGIAPNICVNGGSSYHTVNFVATVLPAGTTATVSVVTGPVSLKSQLFWWDSGPIKVQDGATVTAHKLEDINNYPNLVGLDDPNGSIGNYSLRIEHDLNTSCNWNESGCVFKLILNSGAGSGDCSGRSVNTGGYNATGGSDIKLEQKGECARTLTVTASGGCYSGDVEVSFTVEATAYGSLNIYRNTLFNSAISGWSVEFGLPYSASISFNNPSSNDGSSSMIGLGLYVSSVNNDSTVAGNQGTSVERTLYEFSTFSYSESDSPIELTSSVGTSRTVNIGAGDFFLVRVFEAATAAAKNNAKENKANASIGAASVDYYGPNGQGFFPHHVSFTLLP